MKLAQHWARSILLVIEKNVIYGERRARRDSPVQSLLHASTELRTSSGVI